MLFTLNDFNTEAYLFGTGYLEGSDANDLLLATEPNPGSSNNGRNRLEGSGGNDILIGSSGSDMLNAGSGDGYIFAGGGRDTVYIDHTGYNPILNSVDNVYVDFTDTDNASDTLVFGNDLGSYGTETLGTTFVEVKGWGAEDRLLLRDLGHDINDYYFTVPAGSDLLVRVVHDNNLSVIRIEDVVAQGINVNIVQQDTI